MHSNSDAEDAKDNCIACLVRILEKYAETIGQQEYDILFGQIMTSIPLQGDPSENETVIKFAMNVNNLMAGKLEPFMDKLSLTCLKILTDTRVVKDISDEFKVLTVKFIKQVIMATPENQARLGQYESQMSAYEKEVLAKWMARA